MPGGDPAAGAAENRRRHASVGVVAPGRRQCQAEATWAGARGFAAGLLGGGGAVLLLSRLSPGFRTKVGVRCARGLRRPRPALAEPPPARRGPLADAGGAARHRRGGARDSVPGHVRGRPDCRVQPPLEVEGPPSGMHLVAVRQRRSPGSAGATEPSGSVCTDPEGPPADGGRGSGKTALAVSPAFYLFTLWGEQVLTACVRRGRDFDRISERNT